MVDRGAAGCCLVVVVLAAIAAGCASDRGAPAGTGIQVSAVYATQPVMGERSAMYFTINNRADSADELTGISTDIAGKAELHRTVKDGGLMKMEAARSLVVAAGGQVQLQPGGYHVMLSDLRAPLAAGDEFTATLHFLRAGDLTVRARVVPLSQIEDVLSAEGAPGGAR